MIFLNEEVFNNVCQDRFETEFKTFSKYKSQLQLITAMQLSTGAGFLNDSLNIGI
jgi:hypothetical protein